MATQIALSTTNRDFKRRIRNPNYSCSSRSCSFPSCSSRRTEPMKPWLFPAVSLIRQTTWRALLMPSQTTVTPETSAPGGSSNR